MTEKFEIICLDSLGLSGCLLFKKIMYSKLQAKICQYWLWIFFSSLKGLIKFTIPNKTVKFPGLDHMTRISIYRYYNLFNLFYMRKKKPIHINCLQLYIEKWCITFERNFIIIHSSIQYCSITLWKILILILGYKNRCLIE